MAAYRKNGKWVARLRRGQEQIYLGTFGSEATARAACEEERRRITLGTSFICQIGDTIALTVYADRRQVRVGTLKRWVHEGMPVVTIGNRVRVREADADAWVAEHHQQSVAFARQSVVYVARRESDSALKIGWTSDVERRMRELRAGGDPVVLVAALPGDKPDELRLHDAFAAQRLEGEWFAVSEDDAVRALRETA